MSNTYFGRVGRVSSQHQTRRDEAGAVEDIYQLRCLLFRQNLHAMLRLPIRGKFKVIDRIDPKAKFSLTHVRMASMLSEAVEVYLQRPESGESLRETQDEVALKVELLQAQHFRHVIIQPA